MTKPILQSLIALIVLTSTAIAADLTGKVVGVHDGDTLTLLVTGNQQVKVRLGEIDTPELAQPYGQKAKQALSDLAFSKTAKVVVQDTDRYGRTVGRVYVGSTDVNAELVKQGAAWVYRQYLKDSSLIGLEDAAKAANQGLWALPASQRVPPWDWRKGEKTSAPVTTPVSSGSFTCSGKKVCREMTSCEEAKFYLTQCGVSSLDGNRDGTPCEKLCQ